MHRFIPALYGAPPLPDLPGGFAFVIEPWSKDLLYKQVYEVVPPGGKPLRDRMKAVWDSLKVGGQPSQIITPQGMSNPAVFTYLDSQGKPMAKVTMIEIAEREIGYAEKNSGTKVTPGATSNKVVLGAILAGAALFLYSRRKK